MDDIIISGDSMMPTLSHGEKVCVSKSDTYHKGDIVCFYLPGKQQSVIHRVIKIYKGIIYSCGDNRLIPDIGIKKSYISGKVKFKYAGNKHLQIEPCRRFILTLIFIRIYIKFRILKTFLSD